MKIFIDSEVPEPRTKKELADRISYLVQAGKLRRMKDAYIHSSKLIGTGVLNDDLIPVKQFYTEEA